MTTINPVEAGRVLQMLVNCGKAYAQGDPGQQATDWAGVLDGESYQDCLAAARALAADPDAQRATPALVKLKAQAIRLARGERPPSAPGKCMWCRARFDRDFASGGCPPAWPGATICRDCHDTKVPQTAPRICDVCEQAIFDPEWTKEGDYPRRAAWPKAKCHLECLEAWKAGAGPKRRAAARAELEHRQAAKHAEKRPA
ncbi:MAG: hypothetical protein LBK42_02000 [Propionibacteriaceae bacterium]|jgi:hypothetical protein|nr:hypothetical protein [Propionibacteriaceae bacterium]